MVDVGDYVRIVWDDHASQSDWHDVNDTSYQCITFESFGRVVEVREDVIVIAQSIDANDCDYVGHVMIIVRSAVKSVEKLTWQ